jgi:L-lactate dehydrogenase complex protein LldG
MQESTSREKVLKRIRNALIEKTPNPSPAEIKNIRPADSSDEIPELAFAKHLREAGGHFIFCTDMLEFADSFLNLAQEKKWKSIRCHDTGLMDFLKKCEFPVDEDPGPPTRDSVTLMECECLVAQHGSILTSSASGSGRARNMYSNALVVVSYADQIISTIDRSLKFLMEKYERDLPSSITYISGPSSTADIGNELVIGAQGPAELYLYMIDKR